MKASQVRAAKTDDLGAQAVAKELGGLPVIADDKVIGAVGVSGVTSAQDEQVALAALQALKA